MTPEQRGKEVVERLCEELVASILSVRIAAAIRAAVAEEREACAQIAYDDGEGVIAETIQARSEKV